MKSLKTIQVIAKILRILLVIGFVACIVGASICLISLILLPIFQDVVLYEDKTITILLAQENIPLYEAYASMSVGLLGCGVGIFLCKYNELFFKEEIDLGTPFTRYIVKKMRVVAVVDISVSFAVGLISGLAFSIVGAINHAKVDFKGESFSFVGFGIALLIISLFCEYGAEIKEEKDNEPKN